MNSSVAPTIDVQLQIKNYEGRHAAKVKREKEMETRTKSPAKKIYYPALNPEASVIQ